MARQLLTLQAPGNPSAGQFIAELDAAWAALTDPVVVGVNINLSDPLPAYNRTYRIVIEYDDAGGAPMSAPYQVQVLEGPDLDAVRAQWQALRAANPTWFFSPVYFEYTDDAPNQPNRSLLVLFTCADAANGSANWQA